MTIRFFRAMHKFSCSSVAGYQLSLFNNPDLARLKDRKAMIFPPRSGQRFNVECSIQVFNIEKKHEILEIKRDFLNGPFFSKSWRPHFFGLTYLMKCSFFGLTFSKKAGFQSSSTLKRHFFGLTSFLWLSNILLLLVI